MKVKDVEAMICHFDIDHSVHIAVVPHWSRHRILLALRLTSLMRVSQSTWDWLPRTCHQSKSVAAISPLMKHSKPSEEECGYARNV